MSAETQALARTGARAVLWNYASFSMGKFLVLISTGILARLLTPDDFGILGFALVALAYLAVLKELGLGAALIQRRQAVDEASDTVFTLNLILGALLTLATMLVAPAIAGYFDEPLLVPVLRVLAFTFVLEAFGSIHIVRLQRDLDFRRKMIPDAGRAFVKGAVAIGFAVAGFGVWALVVGQLAGVLVAVVLAWVVVEWRPRLRINRSLAKPLLVFGMPLVVVDITYTIWANLDYVIVGSTLGATALGIYLLAYRIPELLILSIWRVVAGAAFPFFSSIQTRPDLLRRGFLSTIRYSQIVIVPLSLGLLIAADPVVRVAFGDQWLQAIPVLRVLAVFALVTSVGVNIGDVYKAIGRTDILAKLSLLDLSILIPALIFGARYGLVGVAWAHAAAGLVDTVIRLVVARRLVGVRFREMGAQLLPATTSGLALAAAAVSVLVATTALAPLPRLLAVAVAGAAAYFTMLWRSHRSDVLQMADWVGLRRIGESVA